MRKLKKLQENSEKLFKEITNKINDQREFLTEEIETIKKHQWEMSERKNTMTEIEKSLESLNNRAEIMEGRISNSEDRNI